MKKVWLGELTIPDMTIAVDWEVKNQTKRPCDILSNSNTVKPVLSRHSKIDKTKILMTNGSLMKVESIAECSLGAFCNAFDLHSAIIGLENQILVFFLVAA